MSATLPLNSPPGASDDELVVAPREKITFDFNPLKDRPFVNLDYDESDNQPDPLAVGVDSPFDPATNSVSVGTSKNYVICVNSFPPQKSVKSEDPDVIVISDDDLQPKVSVKLQNKTKKKKKASNKSVKVERSSRDLRSRSRVETAVVQAKVNKKKKKNPPKARDNQSTAEKSVSTTDNSVTTTENPVTTTEESVTCNETSPKNAPDLLVKELSQKMEERKQAINALKRTRQAEAALARKLVREIMKHDQPRHSGDGRNSKELISKQQRDAESALARKLVQDLSKGCSLEQTVQLMQSSYKSSMELLGNLNCNPGTLDNVDLPPQSQPQLDSGLRKRRKNQNECSSRRKATSQPVLQEYSNPSQFLFRGYNNVETSSQQAISYPFPENSMHCAGKTMANVGARERLVELAHQAPEQRFQMSDLFPVAYPNDQWPGGSLMNFDGNERTNAQVTEQESQVPHNALVASPIGNTHWRTMGALTSSTIHPSHLVAPTDHSNPTGGGNFIIPEWTDHFVRVNPAGQLDPSCQRLDENVRLATPEESSSLLRDSRPTESDTQLMTIQEPRVCPEQTPHGVPNQELNYAAKANVDYSLDRLATIFQRRLAAIQRLQRIRYHERMIAHPNQSATTGTDTILQSLLHCPGVCDDATENPLLGQNAPQ